MEFSNDIAYTNNNPDDAPCCALHLSAPAEAAVKLRAMMDKVEGEDKCTLCKAAEELEKVSCNQTAFWGSSWSFLLILLIMDGFGANKSIDMDALNAYMDVIKKKSQESDCKLQNES